MTDEFGVAAFRSRQQVMAFAQTLRRLGVGAEIVSTPRSIALGCGLSVRFELGDKERVKAALRGGGVDVGNLIGLYRVIYDETGRGRAVAL